MKKLICLLLALLMLAGAACAQETAATQAPEFITIGFEDGFALSLPQDWMHYNITQEMADSGVLYCLSDMQGGRWLYIQSWDTDCKDISELSELINANTKPENSGIYTFNGTDFVVYDLVDQDVSCCAVLLDQGALNFVFTPQSDSEFMVIAAQIISSFTLI